MVNGKSSRTHSRRQRLINELRDKSYRDAFVEAHAGDSIAFQLKAMRLARDMGQRDVAGLLGNPDLQPMISRYENPDYGKYSVNTLLALARTFDVALVVHFAPFSELVDWDLSHETRKLVPSPFDKDDGLWGHIGGAFSSLLTTPYDLGKPGDIPLTDTGYGNNPAAGLSQPKTNLGMDIPPKFFPNGVQGLPREIYKLQGV
jgi:transcriptional regulator with XRE-family HTH domain